MVQAFVYLSERFFVNIYQFFKHWYYNSFFNVSHFMVGVFESMDKTFALKISLRNLFKPLYQDATPIGYIMGFIFRFLRVIIASLVYGFVFITSVVFYLLWVFIPFYVINKIFKHG